MVKTACRRTLACV